MEEEPAEADPEVEPEPVVVSKQPLEDSSKNVVPTTTAVDSLKTPSPRGNLDLCIAIDFITC